MTHWQLFSSWQLAYPTIRWAFLFVWLGGFGLFCFKSSVCPFPQGYLWVTTCYMRHPGVQDFLRTPFQVAQSSPWHSSALLQVTALPPHYGRNSVSPDSVRSHSATSTTPPLLCACLGFLAGDSTKFNNDAPSSIQNCELPLPLRILISLLSSSFPFPLLALDPNPWTIENYLLFLKPEGPLL